MSAYQKDTLLQHKEKVPRNYDNGLYSGGRDRPVDAWFSKEFFISSIENKCLGDLITGYTLVDHLMLGSQKAILSAAYRACA